MDQLTIRNIPHGITLQRVMDMARHAGLGCGVSGPTVQTDTSNIVYQQPTLNDRPLTKAQLPELASLAEVLNAKFESNLPDFEAAEAVKAAMGYRLELTIFPAPQNRNSVVNPNLPMLEQVNIEFMIPAEDVF